MNFKTIKKISIPIILLFFLLLPVISLAEADPVDPRIDLKTATPKLIKDKTDLPAIIGAFIKTLIGLLGVVFVVLIVYAGFLWMTASGEPDKIKKARGIITAGITGLIITLSAYAITIFVLNSLGVS